MVSPYANIEYLCLPLLFIAALVSKTFFWIGFLSTQLWPLSYIPGPKWASYSRLWLIRTLASGKSAQIFIDVNRQYGPLARIGPKHLLTDDPEVTRRVLAVGSRYTRAPWFNSLRIDPHVPNVVSERDPKKHSQLRYKLSAGYTGASERTIDEHIRNWLLHVEKCWLSQPGNSSIFDIGKEVQFLAVDIVTQLCLGEAFGCVESSSDRYGFLATVRTASAVSQHLTVLLEFNTLLFYLCKIPIFRRLIVPSAKDKTGIGRIMGIIKQSVDQRLKPDATPKKDMLSAFLEKGISREHVETELVVSLVAGSDTTSTAIQGTLLAILSNPRVYRKLQSEIDTAVSQNQVSSLIQDLEARRMPYLQACILEGLRKYPPISQLREQMVPAEGDVICGYRVPGGTFIGLNSWGTQLNEVFGDDPEVYRPERWFDEDPERLQAMHQAHELIFGYGSAKCMGVRIATMQLNKIFFESTKAIKAL